MALHKIKDFDPDYRSHFDNDDVIGLDLYSENDKVGSVDNVLVDDNGEFRYLVINTGIWVFGKTVLLPIGSARIDYSNRRVYAKSLTRSQVESLPEFDENTLVDYDHEERVRNVYRPSAGTGLAGAVAAPDRNMTPDYNRDTYSYRNEPDLYNLNDQDHQSLRLYQERLIASKTRRKAGEVTIGKHVETETAQVSVPIEKERVVIERNPVDSATIAPGEANFQEGQVAHMEVYEETPDIRKEAFVREEVRVKKVVDQETVTAEETVRREELDINTEGRAVINKNV
ncbi:MAG: DUF2382 domain-containing protein [Myxacorys chilensis ATA2-1-KO14]|jgi:uncharacterized protein (TIGR02271 family)|nr:DUF2382 domain-containing protein [Myxacorys chilensis ATA2-1-KO14]